MIGYYDQKYQLNIRIIDNDTNILNYYSNFKNYYTGDSGIDLYNPTDIIIEPLQNSSIKFKIECEMIDLETNNYTSYYLVPRSSISNTNLIMTNSIGIIDACYRGEIMAKVKNMNLNQNEIIYKDTRLFQIIAPDLKPIKINIVNELSSSVRNNNGFGSTN
jgi:dUTP pyrophosphatase